METELWTSPPVFTVVECGEGQLSGGDEAKWLMNKTRQFSNVDIRCGYVHRETRGDELCERERERDEEGNI